MGEYEQLVGKPINNVPDTNRSRFDQYVLPAGTNAVMLKGGVAERDTTQTAPPLQGNVKDTEYRAAVNADNGIYTSCWKISDADPRLSRDVFYDPKSRRVFHDVYLKQSDFPGTSTTVNLYDNTGHVITPVFRSWIGTLFNVTTTPSSITIYDSLNNETKHDKSQAAIPDGLKQKYNKYKPVLQGLFKNIRY